MARFPAVGDAFGQYRITGVLGRGPLGVVFEALDSRLSRSVALKVFSPVIADDPMFRSRFESDRATAITALNSLHITQIFERGEQDGCLYLAVQLIPEGDFGAYVASNGALGPKATISVVNQLCEALGEAYAAGVVHGDIKPTNVLVRERGSVLYAYLCDFGTASLVDGQGMSGGGYRAPELHEGVRADLRSDVYSIGCLLWFTLTGTAPYTGTDLQVAMAHLRDPIPQLAPTDEPTVRLNAIIAKALAKIPGERYADPQELAAALAALSPAPTSVSVGEALPVVEPAETPLPEPEPAAPPVVEEGATTPRLVEEGAPTPRLVEEGAPTPRLVEEGAQAPVSKPPEPDPEPEPPVVEPVETPSSEPEPEPTPRPLFVDEIEDPEPDDLEDPEPRLGFLARRRARKEAAADLEAEDVEPEPVDPEPVQPEPESPVVEPAETPDFDEDLQARIDAEIERKLTLPSRRARKEAKAAKAAKAGKAPKTPAPDVQIADLLDDAAEPAPEPDDVEAPIALPRSKPARQLPDLGWLIPGALLLVLPVLVIIGVFVLVKGPGGSSYGDSTITPPAKVDEGGRFDVGSFTADGGWAISRTSPLWTVTGLRVTNVSSAPDTANFTVKLYKLTKVVVVLDCTTGELAPEQDQVVSCTDPSNVPVTADWDRITVQQAF